MNLVSACTLLVCCYSAYIDKTCKLWSAETGQLHHTYRGHATEIVCLSFNPQGTQLATGSMDNTSRLWDVETGECTHTLLGHTAEIVSLDFDTQGNRIITGSFDNTVKVWDVRTGRCIHTLTGHQGEISSCQFNYASDLCISGSIDRTCKVGMTLGFSNLGSCHIPASVGWHNEITVMIFCVCTGVGHGERHVRAHTARPQRRDPRRLL